MKKQLLSIISACTVFTAFAQLPVSTMQENRKVILEEFTGFKCQYCPDGHRLADLVVAANPGNAFAINVHVGGYANPSTVTAQPDYRTAFGTALANQSTLAGYPAGTINRHVFPGMWQTSGGTAISRNYFNTASNQIMAELSNVNVALQATIDSASRVMTVDVEVYYTGNSVNSTNLFNLALVQDSILGPQTSGSVWYPAMMVGSLYQHQKMLRHMLTGQWGDTIHTTTTGFTFAKQYTYTIPAQMPVSVTAPAYNTDVLLSKLRLIGFVTEGQQEIITGNTGPIVITKPAPIPDGIIKYSGLDEYSANLYPNPTSGNTTLALLISKSEKVTVKMYNMLGAEVNNYSSDLEKGMHAIELDNSKLESGVYFVRIAVGNKVRTEKLNISK
ncbi:MAG: Omp28-related outer membrane protein [Bacteroidota bacterium]